MKLLDKDARNLPILSLAYLGDSVFETLVREMLVTDGIGDIHRRANEYVTAVAQSAAAEKLLPQMTDEELSLYKRGRNSVHTAPKSATHAQYSRATGLECVFGYLYLTDNESRMKELFSLCFSKN